MQAFDFHEHAAQMGHVSACYELATKFEDGLGCIKSDESALSWYRKAAKTENFSALMRLGSGYVIGDGVTITKELGTAFQYFQRVSDPGPKVDEVCAHVGVSVRSRASVRKPRTRTTYSYPLTQATP